MKHKHGDARCDNAIQSALLTSDDEDTSVLQNVGKYQTTRSHITENLNFGEIFFCIGHSSLAAS